MGTTFLLEKNNGDTTKVNISIDTDKEICCTLEDGTIQYYNLDTSTLKELVLGISNTKHQGNLVVFKSLKDIKTDEDSIFNSIKFKDLNISLHPHKIFVSGNDVNTILEHDLKLRDVCNIMIRKFAN